VAGKMFPEVRRVSAILAALRSVAFQERVVPGVAATAQEASAALVEQRDLGQSNSPMHPNQVRTDARKVADMPQERHKAVIRSPFRYTEWPRCNRSRTSLCTRPSQPKERGRRGTEYKE